jgi:hypothetical protein
MNERVLFRSCPLCEGAELADFAAGNCSAHSSYHSSLEALIRWRQCARCAHVFTEGYYTDQACELIFAKTQEQQQAGCGIEQHRMSSSRIVEKVLPYADRGTWLDIGFGNGSLLFTALEYGFTPVGLDLRADNVKTMCSLGIECHCMDISQLALRSGCSVISMADVLEHLPYLKTALQAAHRLLSDEGILGESGSITTISAGPGATRCCANAASSRFATASASAIASAWRSLRPGLKPASACCKRVPVVCDQE